MSNVPENPKSRIEEYLAVIAGVEGSTLPEYPESRIEEYLDYIAKNGGGGKAEWGSIEGDLDDQTDLSQVLGDKANSEDLAEVATSGDYEDLDNKPEEYELPTASESVLGGVKVGEGLSITDGVLSLALEMADTEEY